MVNASHESMQSEVRSQGKRELGGDAPKGEDQSQGSGDPSVGFVKPGSDVRKPIFGMKAEARHRIF